MKKRVMALIAAVIAAFSAFSVTAGAYDFDSAIIDEYPVLRYTYAASASSVLTVSGTTASCSSKETGKTGVTKVVATQYLEKLSGSSWFTVNGAEWTKTANSATISMSNSKSGLSSGTYRLRTVFAFYSGTEIENVVKISSEKTIN